MMVKIREMTASTCRIVAPAIGLEFSEVLRLFANRMMNAIAVSSGKIEEMAAEMIADEAD